MKRLIVLAALVGAGCSIFYDPSKAPKVPCSPAVCPNRTNANPRCMDDACAYACVPGFADTNGDLTKGGSNGCEDACAPASAPAELHAIVGIPSQAIHWVWDPPDAGAVEYRLCTGTAATQLTNCRNLNAATACMQPKGGFACSSTQTGLPNNLRHHGRIQSIDRCGVTSNEATAPTRNVTPINGELLSMADLTTDTNCGAQLKAVIDGGVLRLTQGGFCVGAILFGDDEWRDFTLHAETRITDSARAFWTGVGFHYRIGTKERREIVLLTDSAPTEATLGVAMLTPSLAVDKLAATSIGPVEGNRWLGLDVVASGPDVAVSLGPAESTAKLMLRWREALGTSAASGRLGVYLATVFYQESVEFRAITVSTKAVLPDAGSGSRKLDFSGVTMPDVRITPPGTASLTMVPCPSHPAASGCPADGGCLPAPGARCVHITPGADSKSSMAFDQPLGLDPAQPWRLSFKFAPTALGTNPQILRTLSAVANQGSVLRGPAAGWVGKLSVFGAPTDAGVSPNTWNRISLHFTQASLALEVNGIRYPISTFPPGDIDAHLGAFVLGGTEGLMQAIEGDWTDIEISQPP